MFFIPTRANLRDGVRREFGQIPPIDNGAGAAGAQPVRNPWPTNPQINQQLDTAVAYVSRKGKLAGDFVARMLPVAATSSIGPLAINLQFLGATLSTNEIRRVAWYSGNGVSETLLTASTRFQMDRDRMPTMAQTPSSPTRYWTEGGRLLIWPAPSSDGTLSLMAGVALWSMSQNLDGELLEIVPTDHIPLVVFKTVSLLCGTQPEDRVLQRLKQAVDTEIKDNMEPDFVEWARTRTQMFPPQMVPEPIRSGMMRGRR